MNHKARTRGNALKTGWLGAVAGTAILLAPVYAHAQSVPLSKALPADGYASNGYASSARSLPGLTWFRPLRRPSPPG
jgi:hypothetical protein